ncbi:hypothetical protein [Methylobacterium platani]|uniref:Uncharacterized protein n=2 Tax=Methylobacterium platani TaxID=427683 RepID=A0A179SEI2_9HYPH|nr:hypothetical protein [Methylobacterium platani]KMO20383.1 hypothetical protein SQ03_05705 [Methylobacterium platani JCM 14648]OAS26286.1 hypothetical protein A5481_06090 [Methylobacterium platani]
MKTVKIIETFDAYPTGRALKTYAKGDELEVSDEFGDLIIGKGHAREVAAKAAAAAAETTEAPAKATSTKEQSA